MNVAGEATGGRSAVARDGPGAAALDVSKVSPAGTACFQPITFSFQLRTLRTVLRRRLPPWMPRFGALYSGLFSILMITGG